MNEQALTWIDAALATAGIERAGEPEPPRVRPWATVVRIPTTGAAVWMKACAPETSFEVAVYELLARVAPERILVPIATDPVRGWLLLPDGGAGLREHVDGRALAEELGRALAIYGEVQRRFAPHADDLVRAGVPDMRPAVMLDRFDEALDIVRDYSTADNADLLDRIAAVRDDFRLWCDELSSSRVPPSLDHNDFHDGNVLGSSGHDARFYDWGDSVVAHPFAVALLPLGMMHARFDVALDDPLFVRATDAYLAGFTGLAPGEDLVSTLQLACRVAKVARARTWDRALRSTRAAGERIEPDFADAPLRCLETVLDDLYSGAAWHAEAGRQ